MGKIGQEKIIYGELDPQTATVCERLKCDLLGWPKKDGKKVPSCAVLAYRKKNPMSSAQEAVSPYATRIPERCPREWNIR